MYTTIDNYLYSLNINIIIKKVEKIIHLIVIKVH